MHCLLGSTTLDKTLACYSSAQNLHTRVKARVLIFVLHRFSNAPSHIKHNHAPPTVHAFLRFHLILEQSHCAASHDRQ